MSASARKNNFLIRDKNNVVFSGFAFFTKCVPVLPVRGSHSFTGHQSRHSKYLHEWEKAVSVFANGVYRRK